MKGGYQIVNCGNTAIATGTAVTITGVHEAIEGAYRKPLLLSGVVLDGVEHGDVWIEPTNADGTYTFSAYGHNWTVTAADEVTVAAA